MTKATERMAAAVSKAIGSKVEIDAGSVLVVYAATESARDAAAHHVLGLTRLVDRAARIVETGSDELGPYACVSVDWHAVERNAPAAIAVLSAMDDAAPATIAELAG